MAMRWYQHSVHGVYPAPSDSCRLPTTATAATSVASHRATGASDADTWFHHGVRPRSSHRTATVTSAS